MRVIIIRAGALGDTVFATALIDAIYQYDAEAEIDWVGAPIAHALFAADDRIHRVFSLKYRKVPVWLSAEKRNIVNQSKQAPYDLLINLEDHRKYLGLARGIAAKKKIGTGFTQQKAPAHGHAVELKLQVLSASDIPYQHAAPTLKGADWLETQAKYQLPDKFVVLHAGNSHAHKSNYLSYRAWPVSYWQKLTQLVSQQHHVVLVGSKDEEPILKPLLSQTAERVTNLVGQTSIVELISVLAAAQALVTTDTGPSHIGAAVRTPVLALFGPSDHTNTGPYQGEHNRVEIISLALPCSPCSKTDRIKQCQENRCMLEMSPEMVFERLTNMLG